MADKLGDTRWSEERDCAEAFDGVEWWRIQGQDIVVTPTVTAEQLLRVRDLAWALLEHDDVPVERGPGRR